MSNLANRNLERYSKQMKFSSLDEASQQSLTDSRVLLVGCGALGCAIGTLAHGWKAASIVGSGQGGGKFVVLEMVVSGDIIAVGLALSLAMGLLGGLLPSIWAMLVRPLESLR